MDKFIFIDRDGVINRDPAWVGKDYVTCWEDFEFLPGALEALRDLTNKGFKIIIISNQAGVAKGLYSKEELDKITKNMLEKVEASGGKIYFVQYCLHRNEDNCDCRKPKTGMFKIATEGLRVDFTKTYFIGDSKRDVEAGKKIGCRTILVLTGKIKNKEEIKDWGIKPDFVKKDLMEAITEVLG